MHQVLQKPGVIYNVEVKGRYSGAISLVYTPHLDYGVIVIFSGCPLPQKITIFCLSCAPF